MSNPPYKRLSIAFRISSLFFLLSLAYLVSGAYSFFFWGEGHFRGIILGVAYVSGFAKLYSLAFVLTLIMLFLISRSLKKNQPAPLAYFLAIPLIMLHYEARFALKTGIGASFSVGAGTLASTDEVIFPYALLLASMFLMIVLACLIGLYHGVDKELTGGYSKQTRMLFLGSVGSFLLSLLYMGLWGNASLYSKYTFLSALLLGVAGTIGGGDLYFLALLSSLGIFTVVSKHLNQGKCRYSPYFLAIPLVLFHTQARYKFKAGSGAAYGLGQGESISAFVNGVDHSYLFVLVCIFLMINLAILLGIHHGRRMAAK